MTLQDTFRVDAGSVIGRLHVDKHMNNQDSHAILYNDDFIIAVISDGCSGAPRSEVGSYLTAHYVARSIAAKLPIPDDIDKMMEEVRLDTSSFLRNIASQLSHSMISLQDALLATALGFVVTPKLSFFFSIGDGCFYLNGDEISLNNEHASKPDMVVYQAINPALLDEGVRHPFAVYAFLTDTIRTMVVASDGLHNLLQAEGQTWPGNIHRKITPLDEFVKLAIQPQLWGIGKTVYRAQYDRNLDVATQTVEKSPLLDDTTIIALGRK